jgi:hypothetical protein
LDERDKLRAENERLRNALKDLYEACLRANAEYELSGHINGDILDAAQQVLKEVRDE